MRAQFWSFDGIFAMSIFVTALVLLIFVWNNMSSQFSLAYGYGAVTMQAQVQSLQNRIITQGAPANWNSFVNVSKPQTWYNFSIGLGTGNGTVLSASKIATFLAMADCNTLTYQSTKPLLGVGYDYYITISEGNATMAFGVPPYAYRATSIQVTRQSVVINGVPAMMQIEVWTNRTFGVS